MKKLFLILITYSLVFPSISLGQTLTPSKSKIPDTEEIKQINEKIDELKDKVASRVAELKLVEKRGLIGIVESVSDTQIRITDLNKKTRLIDVDELTKFSSDDDTTFGISDIKKGSKLSVLGLYNKESERLLARFVNEVTIPLFLNGVISKKDEENFTLILTTEDGTDYTIDVEKITKNFAYMEGKLEISGFTKIGILENSLVIGFSDPKEKNRVTGSRIITFPDLPKNPKVPIVETPSPTLTPSPTKEK